MEKRIIMPPTIILRWTAGVISIEKCAKVIESLA